MQEFSCRKVAVFRRSTLAVIATFVLVLGASGSVRAGTPFTDVSGSPFLGDIEWAEEAGITGGCTPTKFCPKASVTRAQMASFLVRMFDLPPTSADHFTDDEDSVHQRDINALAESGVTGGCSPNRYCPRALVTREQMAAFIVRAAILLTSLANPFYDDDFRPFERDINKLAAEGIGTGCGPYRFCPLNFVTREQMVGFLHRVEEPVNPPPGNAPCDRSYTPNLCIPSPPPQLDCTDIPHRNFFVRPPDPHVFDGNSNGVGCEE